MFRNSDMLLEANAFLGRNCFLVPNLAQKKAKSTFDIPELKVFLFIIVGLYLHVLHSSTKFSSVCLNREHRNYY